MSHSSPEMLVLGLLVALSLSFSSIRDDPADPASGSIRLCLLLPPGPGNPRNSEGDLLRLTDGSLLYCWTRFSSGRGSDHDPASLAMVVSRDDGATWSDPREVVHASDGMNVMSVTLRRLDDGRIALFNLHKRSLLDCRPVVRFSKDEGETWSDAIEIVPADDVGYDVLNNDRVLIDEEGVMIVPVARHAGAGVGDTFRPSGRLRCHRSEDGGKTWTAGSWAPGAEGVVLQEPGLFMGRDGLLRMFARTNAGRQFIMESKDGGLTFSAARPWTLRSPLSPATVERLAGGICWPFGTNLLLEKMAGMHLEHLLSLRVRAMMAKPGGYHSCSLTTRMAGIVTGRFWLKASTCSWQPAQVIEGRRGRLDAMARDDLHARRVRRDGAGHGIVGLRLAEVLGRHHDLLVDERGARDRSLGPADDNAVRPTLHDARVEIGGQADPAASCCGRP